MTATSTTARPNRQVRARPDHLTSRGLILFGAILLVAGSAFKWSRINVGGLSMHPYLPPMVVVFFLAALPRISRFPVDILRILVLFTASYALTTISGSFSGAMSEIVKVASSVLTIVTIALAIRTEPDFRAAVLALNIAIVIMSMGALLRGGGGGLLGINPLDEIANKNAFSMYALPAILLAGHVALDARASRWMRLALVGSAIAISFAVFATANRSGWVGIVLVLGLLLSRGRRVQGLVLVGVMGIAIYMFVGRQEGTRNVFAHRYQQTVQGYHSDELRKTLFRTALQIGLDHPVMGVGPTRLPNYLAARIGTRRDAIDSHNVFGHLMGGCGMIVTGIFLFGGFLMVRKPRRMPPGRLASDAHALLRMMIVLWIMRGMFSREILYNPSFAIGIGMCLALCMMNGMWARFVRAPVAVGRIVAAPRPATPSPSPAPAPTGGEPT